MTELEKIRHARNYVEKLANGVNPLNGFQIPDEGLLNDVRISRCLFYVADVLRRVEENGGVIKPGKKQKKLPFRLSYDQRHKYEYSAVPITISELTRRINSLIDEETMSKIRLRHISDWLLELGLLESGVDVMGKSFRRPTAKGMEFGLSTIQRRGENGEYTQTLYNRSAQQFIVDNLDAVLEFNNSRQ